MASVAATPREHPVESHSPRPASNAASTPDPSPYRRPHSARAKGVVRAFNRGILTHIGTLAAMDEDTARLEQRLASGLASGRSSQRDPLPQEPSGSSRAEWEAQQRKKEQMAKHEKLNKVRKQDEKSIKERCARNASVREQKFEEMMERMRTEDVARVEAAKMIRENEIDMENKRLDLYNKWDQQVYKAVEHKLQKWMTSGQTVEPSSARGVPGERGDPVKASLVDREDEQAFRRMADTYLQGPSIDEITSDQKVLRARARERELTETTVRTRPKMRPTLPPMYWAQQEHYASPYGYFSQGCEKERLGIGFHSARRMGRGAHQVDESDGVPTAGKTRTRFQHDCLRMLDGDLAKLGEAYEYKRPEGGSSGAPMQDHFFYPMGTKVVDAEFPLGKRCFPHLRAHG
eukprot:gnl/TRDRNA2_/TRDRNA2_180993_c0_seq1.p1 gnl/TRDRNA2_/TRDRNA2_180993_c0~~gnl/TRDRNA2_/TRDRNA2_180993_c0_seq1.p1  ORF type:complete len:404 (+),score=74.87 gnl/TRDRNA2_/TRDRNA2_180993_c0_seq1:76-1287(+)